MAIRKPFNLTTWIEENRDLLKPPVGNKNLYVDSGDYIVMIVAGPNARKDYHYNETEELFYQLEGQITVRIQEDGKAVDMKLSLATCTCTRPVCRTARCARRVRSAWSSNGNAKARP